MRNASLAFALLAAAIAPAWASTESVLYNFPTNPDLGEPQSRLLWNSSTATLFGTASGFEGAGLGQVFSLIHSNNTWTERTILAFGAQAEPWAGLVQDASGDLFGATEYGGTNNAGVVFELTRCRTCRKWTEHVLWNFGGTGDGATPYSDLIMDSGGNIYGTTVYGGASGNGTVFALTPAGKLWTEQTLYSFKGGSDGFYPAGTLLDVNGSLFGTTQDGGEGCAGNGCGTVFQLVQSNGTWTEHVLHAFVGGGDGNTPVAGLIADKNGDLFGTTAYNGTGGEGTVFELSTNGHFGWRLTTLYSFKGGSDGGAPVAALQWNPSQTILYGTTEVGGAYTYGTVYKLTLTNGSWTEAVLHGFGQGSDGKGPNGAVVLDSSGNLYGTTFYGGANDTGIIYEIPDP